MFGYDHDYSERETPFERACRALRGRFWTPEEAEELMKLVQTGTRANKK